MVDHLPRIKLITQIRCGRKRLQELTGSSKIRIDVANAAYIDLLCIDEFVTIDKLSAEAIKYPRLMGMLDGCRVVISDNTSYITLLGARGKEYYIHEPLPPARLIREDECYPTPEKQPDIDYFRGVMDARYLGNAVSSRILTVTEARDIAMNAPLKVDPAHKELADWLCIPVERLFDKENPFYLVEA